MQPGREVYQHQPYDARDSVFENSDSHPSRFSRNSWKSWKSWNVCSIVMFFIRSWVGRSTRDQHVSVRLLTIPNLYRAIFETLHRFCARQDRGITFFTISRFSRFHDFHEFQTKIVKIVKTREPHGQTLRQSNSNSFTVFSFQWPRALLDEQRITGRPFDFGRRVDSPRATLRFSRFSRFSWKSWKSWNWNRNFASLVC